MTAFIVAIVFIIITITIIAAIVIVNFVIFFIFLTSKSNISVAALKLKGSLYFLSSLYTQSNKHIFWL